MANSALTAPPLPVDPNHARAVLAATFPGWTIGITPVGDHWWATRTSARRDNDLSAPTADLLRAKLADQTGREANR